jgi:hypothetical protein
MFQDNAAPPAPGFEPVLGGGASSLLGGVVGAIVGATVATGLWYAVVAFSGWQIGLVAVAVGFIVARAAVFGAGSGSIPLVVVSVVFTLLALVVSEYLIVYHFITQSFGTEGAISVIQPLDFVVTVVSESVQAEPITLLFWAIALFQAVAIPLAAMRDAPKLAPAQTG